jgi:hypothetical protein
LSIPTISKPCWAKNLQASDPIKPADPVIIATLTFHILSK